MRVIIGMDPHKRSATIEVIDQQARVLATGTYDTDNDGYGRMLCAVRVFRERVWAVEGLQRDRQTPRAPTCARRGDCRRRVGEAVRAGAGVRGGQRTFQARAAIATIRPRDIVGKTRRRLVVELIGELEGIDKKIKSIDKDLTALVVSRGSTLLELHGIGPSGAARLLADIGDITRFATRDRFASWNGTAPLDASSGQQLRHPLSRAGNRRINRTLHIMAVVQLRNPTEGRVYFNARKTEALYMMGWHAAHLGDYDAALADCQEALAQHRHHNNPDGEIGALKSLGYIAHHTGHHRKAVEYCRQALAMCRVLGHAAATADLLDQLGHPHIALDERDQVRAVWLAALRLYREQGRDTEAEWVQRKLENLDQMDTDQPCHRIGPGSAGW